VLKYFTNKYESTMDKLKNLILSFSQSHLIAVYHLAMPFSSVGNNALCRRLVFYLLAFLNQSIPCININTTVDHHSLTL